MNEFAGRARNVVLIEHNQGTIQFMAPEHPVPQEIEPPVAGFVNRADDLAWLHARSERVVVLEGMSGIGKTALARSFVAGVRDRFPGGQLSIDRTRFTSPRGNVDLSAMVGACLSALGEKEKYQPASLGARIQRFRSRTSEEPCLVLLENATEPAQVTALKPAHGMILVTTQRDLSELEADDDVAFRRLRFLDPEHSLGLFASLCAGAPPKANDLVPYAAGMPLAIKMIAGRVRRLHDVTIDELADELADDTRRLHALALGERAVAAVFAASYQRLPGKVRDLYRLLALLPGVDFAPETAAAIAGADDVRPQLAELADAHLLERRPGGRYAFYELVRIHARELARGDAVEWREAAVARAVRHYLVRAAFADRAILGDDRSRVTDHAELLAGRTDPFAPPADAPLSPEDRVARAEKAARAWFQTERPNLRDAVTAAYDAALHRECWQLGEALSALYYDYRFLREWTGASATASESARVLGDRRAEARLRIPVARAYTDLRDFSRAASELDRAELLATEEDDPVLLASVWEVRGRLLDLTDKPAALAAYERARDLNASAGERPGARRGVVLCLYWHACTLADLDRLEEARAALVDVLERFEAMSERPRMLARVRLSLSRVLSRLGRTDEAAALAETARLAVEGTHYEAEARELLARLFPDSDAAPEHLRRAWEIYDAEGNPRADDLRSR